MRAMRRTASLAFLSLLLVACGAGPGRDLVRYHDPKANITAFLPAEDVITVLRPKLPTVGAPGVVAGVLAEPPARATPSP